MNNENIFNANPVFTHNGESLELKEIISTKTISSVTVCYLSKERKIKQAGLKGLFGPKKVAPEDKEITINDTKGINLTFDGNELATIRFWNKEEFDKIVDGDYDENTLFKRYIMSMVQPYQLNFHIGNLKGIEWQQEIKQDEFESDQDFTFNHGYFPETGVVGGQK